MYSVEEGIIVLLLIVFLDIVETFINSVVDNLFFGHLILRRNKKQTPVINIRKYKRISGKKKDLNLKFRMFQRTSSEVLNR